MTRHVITLASAFVAIACLTLGSSEAEARNCRGRRNRCCQQTCHQRCQQGCNGQQQAYNGGYYNNRQQAMYTTTAPCTQPSTWNSVEPTSGTMQPGEAAPAPAPAGNTLTPASSVGSPAPAPGI